MLDAINFANGPMALIDPQYDSVFTLSFALLAVAAAAISVVGVVGLANKSDSLGIRARLGPQALDIVAAIAVTCTAGSLFLSEALNYDPCLLCWVQRGFMYPASMLLLGGAISQNLTGKPLSSQLGLSNASAQPLEVYAAISLAALGLPVSIFHRYEQLQGTNLSYCSDSTPCSHVWFSHFGMSIPSLAAVGFASTIVLGTLYLRHSRTN